MCISIFYQSEHEILNQIRFLSICQLLRTPFFFFFLVQFFISPVLLLLTNRSFRSVHIPLFFSYLSVPPPPPPPPRLTRLGLIIAFRHRIRHRKAVELYQKEKVYLFISFLYRFIVSYPILSISFFFFYSIKILIFLSLPVLLFLIRPVFFN